MLLFRNTLVLNIKPPAVPMHGDRSSPVWELASQLGELIRRDFCWRLRYLWGLLIGFCPQICPSYQKSCVLASSPWGRGKCVSFVILGRKKLFNYFSVYCYLIVVDTCNIIALYFKRLVFYILLNYVFKCDKIILAFEMVWPCLGEDPLFLLLNGSSIRYINWLHSD